ncbi:hypothetical protein PQQ77_25085 [Paraburkholderia strydomiana]|jgi:hypothetical protein|uniref:hypothetical protein n=1 Tax=Paraburkholderia strydomiana TaxID=1245417 RepID=UPI0038BBCBCA
MYSAIDLLLVLLLGFVIGSSFGVIVGGINRSAKEQEAEQRKTFRVPAAHREFEHECDAHYPRVGE